MSDLEYYYKSLERKKEEYKENIKCGVKLQHEIKELEKNISRLDKGLKSILPVGTKITFKDEDGKIIETIIIEDCKERQTLLLIIDCWINAELSKWHMFDYSCIYSDTLINEFCADYSCEVVKIQTI
ncbi:hypothetical protein [Clostridium sp. VAP52]|uniref:hypothetical protein n=1 Tax=Clostridium sp. VAP52 TaxID=2949977 RepID=UPI002079ED93|nr:hypothetical protein [Clostridium sp. VAP52]